MARWLRRARMGRVCVEYGRKGAHMRKAAGPGAMQHGSAADRRRDNQDNACYVFFRTHSIHYVAGTPLTMSVGTHHIVACEPWRPQ